MPINLDRPCEHKDFTTTVEINRLTPRNGDPVNAFMADVQIHCSDCDESFRFIGMPAGVSGSRPMCSVDEKTAHIPIRPASSDPDFGLGIPGFAVRWTDE